MLWKNNRKKKKYNQETVSSSAPECAYFSERTHTTLRSNFNDQFLMVWRCSGMFFPSPLPVLRRCSRRTLRLFFIFSRRRPSPVHYFFPAGPGRHISASASGYVLFIDVLHVPLLFPTLPPPVRRRRHHYGSFKRRARYAPRIIMCKKPQPIRDTCIAAESWNPTAAAAVAVLHSSHHFHNKSQIRFLCVVAPYMDHACTHTHTRAFI